MRVYDNLSKKNVDELAEWLDKHGEFDGSPWIQWWNENYCSNCPSEFVLSPYYKKKVECSWCELNGKCRFFPDNEELPANKEIIKLWLESEVVDSSSDLN